ncbi:MAG: hypothetical protein ACN6O6_11845 [Pseudomonas sp.]|uniref:hypothetical protein n=1 Tax=Pseudomonas sp. TaxID=306 RepID=UPI003D12A9A1
MTEDSTLQMDFETAMGQEFSELVSPPVPFFEASPHECCEAIWRACGHEVTPTTLAALGPLQLEQLATAFGQWFECEPPATMQLAEAIARTLSRWPPGSLGETG